MIIHKLEFSNIAKSGKRQLIQTFFSHQKDENPPVYVPLISFQIPGHFWRQTLSYDQRLLSHNAQ